MRQVQFQFTPLREGRHDGFITLYRNNSISIHAPPRGATQTSSATSRRKRYFNSRPSARGDHALAQRHRLDKFQFTPLREGRPTWHESAEFLLHFNSRPSARGDTRNRRHCWQWQRFQFTPLREGRRAAAAQSSAAINISIHAPPRGATRGARGFRVSGGGISIHAPPRGATYRAVQP